MKSRIKGWFGETSTQIAIWLALDKNIYRRYHNLIIRTENGTTEIDTIIVSRYGVFVIEVKDYAGWIFGSEKQMYWTQTFHKKKFKFQNPLHQNFKHIKAVSTVLGLNHTQLESVIFFIGDAEIKTEMPPNVLTRGLIPYIKRFKKEQFSTNEVLQFGTILDSIQANKIPKQEHIQNLKVRLNSSTICPKCNNPLVERTAKKGKNAGEKFLGCSTFPKCRFVKPRTSR